MGSIYINSEAVIDVLSCEIGFTQNDVDAATRGLAGALAVGKDETWAEINQAEHFQRGTGATHSSLLDNTHLDPTGLCPGA